MARAHPPVILLASLFVQTMLHVWLPLARIIPRPAALWVGVLAMASGFLLILSSGTLFFRRKTTIVPFQESDALITDGPYHYSRNPIYLGMLVILCGFACLGGSLSAWLVPPVFVFIIQRRFIQYEEAMLEERFGDLYKQYQSRVRRWI